MNRLLVICGPTATGKTSLGIRLAKKYKGEIISADSRQVYRYMDIGTGKELPVNSKFEILSSKQIQNSLFDKKLAQSKQFKIQNYQIGYYLVDGVKVWLYDVVEPNYQFSVADYIECANVVIKDIWKREKLPILVGGTGLYIKAVVDGIETMGVGQDKELRQELSNYPIIQLSNLLKKVDPERWEGMNESDRQNPRRLVRAIEIAIQKQKSKRENKNKSFALLQDFHHLPAGRQVRGVVEASTPPSEVVKAQNFFNKILFIGLRAPNKVLYERIDRRVDERVKEGIVEEVRKLLKMGYSWEKSVLGVTIGYKEWRGYLTSQKSKVKSQKLREEIIQRWKYDEHGYARRQMTWFKKALRSFGKTQDKQAQDKHSRKTEGVWFDISKKEWENEVERLVNNWVSNFRPVSLV